MISTRRLAALLLRSRLRQGWNALRARPAGAPGFLVLLAVGSAAAYVALVAASLRVIGRTAGGADAQATALTLMAGAIALASLTAKASAGDAVLAGSPENEFLLARPLSMARLVAARILVALVTDPIGALFLFPVLFAAAVVWRLPAGAAALLAIATSICAQLTLASLAQAIQLAVVRWVPRRRRALAWVALRLVAAGALGGVWITATSVLRAPQRLAPHLPSIGDALAWTPAPLLTAPLTAWLPTEAGADQGQGAVLLSAGVALVLLLTIGLAAAALAIAVAGWAGLRGWEEAGAPWAEADANSDSNPNSTTSSPLSSRMPLTLARREWRSLWRDRPRLTALILLPALLAGVQIFGPIGWETATATLDRIAVLTFSVTLYMATLGPLAHMQAERRAFWILRAAPVSVGRVVTVKALVWSGLLGGFSLAMFTALLLGGAASDHDARDVARTGALVLVGAVSMTFWAVALGCRAADLTDDRRAAIGPGSVYLFLFAGGLFNLVFDAGGRELAVPLTLYAALVATAWRAGIARAAWCLDAAALAEERRRFLLVDAATLALFAYLGPLAMRRGFTGVGAPARTVATSQTVVLSLVVVAGAWMLLRTVIARWRHARR